MTNPSVLLCKLHIRSLTLVAAASVVEAGIYGLVSSLAAVVFMPADLFPFHVWGVEAREDGGWGEFCHG